MKPVEVGGSLKTSRHNWTSNIVPLLDILSRFVWAGAFFLWGSDGMASLVWNHSDYSWAEQFRAQPALQLVMRSFTPSAYGHDLQENSNRSPSSGQPHLTDIISDLRSELPHRSFLVAGRHLFTQPERRTFCAKLTLCIQFDLVPIIVEWEKTKKNTLCNERCLHYKHPQSYSHCLLDAAP